MATINPTSAIETKSIDAVPPVDHIDSTSHSTETPSNPADQTVKMEKIPGSDSPDGLDGERDSKKQCTEAGNNVPEKTVEVKDTVVDDRPALLAQIEQLKQELAAASDREKAEAVKREQANDEHERNLSIQSEKTSAIIENNNKMIKDIQTEKANVVKEKENIEKLELLLASNEDEIQRLKQHLDSAQHREADLENHFKELQYEYNRLQIRNSELKHTLDTCQAELEAKRTSYKSMEANFYSYLRSIRATDDDHSTIQTEIKQICSKLNNLTMTLRGHADIAGGTSFVLSHWPERETEIREILMTDEVTKEAKDTIDLGFVALFFEKYIFDLFVDRIFNQPVHIGVSVNEAYKQLDEWISERNEEWAGRLRQQMCALVKKFPGKEQPNIDSAKSSIVTEIMDQMKVVYPKADMESAKKKLGMLVDRAVKVSIAMNSQEVMVRVEKIVDGKTEYDEDKMVAVIKGKRDGTVFLSIIPPFVILDGAKDNVLATGKVLCL